MNKVEILAMETGRGMDAKIAWAIYGNHVTNDYREFGENYFVSDSAYKEFCNDYVFDEPPTLLPKYSTDISAAWEVIEEMQVKGFATVLQRQGDYFAPDDLWECQFGHKPMAKDESAQVAICKAALLAVMDS